MSNKIYDALLELRDVADGAETSTASETGVAVPVRYLSNCVVVVYITAIDFTSGNETYVFTVQVSDLVGGTYVTIGTYTHIGSVGVGEFEVPINGALAEGLDADSAFLRITATLGGTSPSVTYGAFLAPATHGKFAKAADLA